MVERHLSVYYVSLLQSVGVVLSCFDVSVLTTFQLLFLPSWSPIVSWKVPFGHKTTNWGFYGRRGNHCEKFVSFC